MSVLKITKIYFSKIPYLNSSLFDPQSEPLEKSCFAISTLNYNRTLPIHAKTVLKDIAGNKLIGDKHTLEYLFEFLNAYNFASDSNDEIQDDSKTIINAAVLGMIFEKINGYKDGSFYTPSFITMYMCREMIRRAVVEKFNKVKSWNCLSFDELYNKIDDRNEANNQINSITICDPAVGSGHFLVSALNELIAIKSELRILQDNEGKRLKEYQIEIVNDELIVTDEDGDLFVYNPSSQESQRVQTTLFHEKQTIIENCLFGVDINPNSVKICRLRLWIELLKNMYYTNKNNHELETLPNIDINIKCGNSLISRFDLDSDLIELLKKAEINISNYKAAVQNYRHARDKQQKMEMAKFIDQIKNNFETKIMYYDKRSKNLEIKQAQLNYLSMDELFPTTQKVQKEKNKKIEKIKKEVLLLRHEIDEITSNKIYASAFEWRFEFPEVLADNGDFIGFDVVIGNPPYMDSEAMVTSLPNERNYCTKKYITAKGNWDLFIPFVELGTQIANDSFKMSYIIPNKILSSPYAEFLRDYINTSFYKIELADVSYSNVFDEASVYPVIIYLSGTVVETTKISFNIVTNDFMQLYQGDTNVKNWALLMNKEYKLYSKIISQSVPINTVSDFQINAAAPVTQAYSLSNIIVQDKPANECLKIINTGTIDRYYSLWGIKSMRYLKQKYLTPFVELKKVYTKTWLLKPKIIIAGMSTRLESLLDEYGEYLPAISTTVISSDNVNSLKLLLAYLNSNIANFMFRAANKHLSMAGGYMTINQRNITKLCWNNTYSEEIIKNVTKIIEMKKSSIQADTSSLEYKIDSILYRLYDLTDDEIRIIEST